MSTEELMLSNWVLEKTLKGPLETLKSLLKEISPEYPLEGLMLMRKCQYFGHLMPKVDSLEKSLMLEKIEGGRRWGRQDELFGWHH